MYKIHMMQAKERLLKLVRRIVEERKAAMDRGDHETLKGPPNDAVDVLLRDTGDSAETSRLSLDFISSNMIEMMIPGEETLPTAMTLAVKFLSDCPVALNQLMVRTIQNSRLFNPTVRMAGCSTTGEWLT